MSLLDKVQKATKEGSSLSESKYLSEHDFVPTPIPAMNVGLSGDIDGGLVPGFTMIAGPSKHFKTLFTLIMMKAYLDKYPDGVGIFYDNEFGATEEYFKSVGIDMSRVIHEPIRHTEDLKFKAAQQLDNLERGDRVFFMIDSIGNLASKKEAEDALSENSSADMTRAKDLASFARIVNPYLTMLDIPMVAINHTYKTMEMYAKDVVSGGTKIMYTADNVWIVGRRQDKNSQKEIEGYNFIIKIEKSRFVKEGSQLSVSVSFNEGVKKYSGLLEMALATGHVYKPKQGWYTRAIADDNGELKEDKNWRENQLINSDEFWTPIFEETDFKEQVQSLFAVGGSDGLMQFHEDHEDPLIVSSPNENQEENGDA